MSLFFVVHTEEGQNYSKPFHTAKKAIKHLVKIVKKHPDAKIIN